MITLVLETSTPHGGVVLFRDGEMVFCESFTADRSHSSGLFAVIEKALGADVKPGRIVVGLGPGSYAGVRIAIAAGIGISVATGAELVGVASIVALDGGEYVAIGDARRGGYWMAGIADGELTEGAVIATREELEEKLAAAGTARVLSSEELGISGVEIRFPSAERIGKLAVEGRSIFARGTLEPIYLREPHITVPK